ncbi:MAG: copper chaperone PCu(A)C [Betaproteobacteria bacterium]|nr:copper chaperone PCu(A)C [Betaproteobacteria bacterium]MDE2123730.1 copper chaperone PCu(A)C [Betaproteobacteria bacterium]MDE2185198.1 copper chaperone PCu(A)C [Betaproteobacteria bacterium]MDE2324752.1 copper chaperone PCu(A)C [Betaproteobacteria bacterium]
MFQLSTPTSRRLLLAGSLAALAWTAAPAFAATAPPPVQASGAWIRWLPANLPAGGYVLLTNTSAKPVELVGADSPDYGNAMLHQSVSKNGVMEMLHVDKVVIPAHGSMAFKPGSFHIMLMQPKKGVKPGDTVPITLKFAGGEAMTVNFDVRKADATGPGGVKGMDMKH